MPENKKNILDWMMNWRRGSKSPEPELQQSAIEDEEEPSNFGTESRKKYERHTDEAFLSALDPVVRLLYERGELDYANPEFLKNCVPVMDMVPDIRGSAAPDYEALMREIENTPVGIEGDEDSSWRLDETTPPGGLESDQYRESGRGALWLISKTSLGTGGVSDVFEGWKVDTVRPVAIKKMKTNLSHSTRLLEMLREAMAVEAKTMARLRHKNMPRIDHMMIDSSGDLLFMMELLENGRFDASTKMKGKLNSHQLATFVTELCDYVGYCAKFGLFHRDLKLGNVFVDKTTGSPRVYDMGISNWAVQPVFDGTGGTLTTMAPERWDGTGRKDKMFESEVFSMGVMFYQLITNENKHIVQTGLTDRQARTQLREIILNNPELTPEQEKTVKKKCEILGINGDVIIDVLNKCLAKDPEDRYHSAQDLAHDFLAAYPRNE